MTSFAVAILLGSVLRGFIGPLQGAHQLTVDRLIAGRHIAGAVGLFAAVEIGDVASRLAYQHRACRNVPRRDVALPIAIKTSRRHPGEVESRGTETPQPRDFVLHGG